MRNARMASAIAAGVASAGTRNQRLISLQLRSQPSARVVDPAALADARAKPESVEGTKRWDSSANLDYLDEFDERQVGWLFSIIGSAGRALQQNRRCVTHFSQFGVRAVRPTS